MRFHNFVYVVVINIAVPHGVWIHHAHGACGAAVQAGRFVDPHFARAVQPGSFDGIFAVRCAAFGVVVGAAGFTFAAFVDAKENVALVVGRFSAGGWVFLGHTGILRVCLVVT